MSRGDKQLVFCAHTTTRPPTIEFNQNIDNPPKENWTLMTRSKRSWTIAVVVLSLALILSACGATATNPNPNPKQFSVANGYIDDGKTVVISYKGSVNGNVYDFTAEVTLGRNERRMGTSFVLRDSKGEENKPCDLKPVPGVSSVMAACDFGALHFEVTDVAPKGRSYVMLHITGATSYRYK